MCGQGNPPSAEGPLSGLPSVKEGRTTKSCRFVEGEP